MLPSKGFGIRCQMLDSAFRPLKPPGSRTEKGGTAAYRFEDSLDRWLKNELDTLYRDVLDAPLPPKLAELVRLYQAKLDAKERAHGRNPSESGRPDQRARKQLGNEASGAAGRGGRRHPPTE
ncbi:MAG: hypothetical protein IH626_08355 [Rhodospirillales bacterium]|nr:hypothetical protein [Rhodospirillales bacterium]